MWLTQSTPFQVPLAWVTDYIHRSGIVLETWGNVIVWASLLVGQPLGIILYCDDYAKLTAAALNGSAH